MDTLFTEAAKQVPALGLMVVVVFIFIRFIGQQQQATRDAFGSVMNEHLDERKQSREAIEANTEALQHNAETRGQLCEVLREVKQQLKQP